MLSHLNTKHKYLLLEEDRTAALVKASGRQDSGASNVVVSVETHKKRMVAFLLTGGCRFSCVRTRRFCFFTLCTEFPNSVTATRGASVTTCRLSLQSFFLILFRWLIFFTSLIDAPRAAILLGATYHAGHSFSAVT
jgi:hypothetical protein